MRNNNAELQYTEKKKIPKHNIDYLQQMTQDKPSSFNIGRKVFSPL